MKIDDIAKQLANKVNQEHYIKHYLEKVQRGAYNKGVKDAEAKQLNLCGVSIALPSRKDYDNRKLKAMYFKKDTSVGNSVLFTKGEQWQPYNWNYQRTIDYLKEGRLGYEC